jgi:hypothetical protein
LEIDIPLNLTSPVSNRSEEHKPGGMGYYLRRVGPKDIISYLKSNPRTADLMKKTFKLNN